MRLPFKGLYIFTQDFGVNAEDYAKFLVSFPDGQLHPMKGHNGLDFGTPTRTECIAPHVGIVQEKQFDEKGYGWYVKIENEKEGSVIAHLDQIDVEVGFHVKEGDHIGWTDNTGNSTGPHCHWGYYTFPRDRANGLAGFINQKPFLDQAGIHLTLGQLPAIDNFVAGTNGTGGAATLDGESTYKGLNLNNRDSIKAAIDAWYDVANGKYKSVEDYTALSDQLEIVKKQLGDTQKSDMTTQGDIKKYHEMQALGYNTVDDVLNTLKKKDTINFDLQQENTQIRGRNITLTGLLKSMDEETNESAQQGLKQVEENDYIKGVILDLAKNLEVKQITKEDMLMKIDILKSMAGKLISIMDHEKKKQEEANAPQQPQKKTSFSGFNWISGLFNLSSSTDGKGVNGS